MFPKEIRKLKKYSLKDVAKKTGTPLGRYWLYENFPNLMPVEVACRFAYIMEVSINDIFFTHNSILNRTNRRQAITNVIKNKIQTKEESKNVWNNG